MAAANHSAASVRHASGLRPKPQAQRAAGHALFGAGPKRGDLGPPETRLEGWKRLATPAGLPQSRAVHHQERVHRFRVGRHRDGARQHAPRDRLPPRRGGESDPGRSGRSNGRERSRPSPPRRPGAFGASPARSAARATDSSPSAASSARVGSSAASRRYASEATSRLPVRSAAAPALAHSRASGILLYAEAVLGQGLSVPPLAVGLVALPLVISGSRRTPATKASVITAPMECQLH